MSLEDLRNAAHRHAKDLHELDVDRQEESDRRATVDAEFAARDAVLSGQARDLSVALQNYQPTEPSVRIRFAQHKYNNSKPIDVSAFDVYDLQRGFTLTGERKPGTELYIYATTVRRPSDKDGLTQFLKPHLVPDTWCAHTPTGGLVTRTRGEGPEVLINIAVAQWRAMAIPNIVDEVVRYDATGLYVDEVDAWWKYAWTAIATTGAREFKTESWWRSMWLQFLSELAGALHAKGKKLWINLGADYNLADLWQSAVVDIVDAVNIEFYTGREGVGAGPTTTSDGWLSQGAFVRFVEERGKPVHVHSSSLDQKVTDYAFTSWLLHTEFLGSFSASLDYGGTFAFPDGALWTKAQALGRPVGKRENDPTIQGFSRAFEHGTVRVKPSSATGLIELK
jgi:hypothetical protein